MSGGSWPTTSTWKIVADRLKNITFAGYDKNMNSTTRANAVHTLGITVQYSGHPAEQEMLTLAGTGSYTALSVHPLAIPPAPPDPR